MKSDLQNSLQLLWDDEQPHKSVCGYEVINKLQKLYDISLPEDFASYLLEASPRADSIDKNGINWWSPEHIKSVGEERAIAASDSLLPEIKNAADSYLIFADYLDRCYDYAICCSDGPDRGKIALVGTTPGRFVASSFLTFVQLATADSDRIHAPAGDRYTDLI